MPDDDPLVVTVTLDERAQQRFEDLRRQHFPAERNHLPAHVTAFHALPAAQLPLLVADLETYTPRRPLPLRVSGVRFLGRGVAYDLQGQELLDLRAALAERWASHLSAQDQQRWRPHVTVQNKVAPDRARALHAELSAQFRPEIAEVIGLALWRYRGGPWELVRRFGGEG